MSERVNDEILERISILAKLEIKNDEKEQLCKDIEKILDYADMIQELDTEKIEPLVQVINTKNVFRDDKVTNGNDKENMLTNAPQKKDGQFVVPSTF